MEIKLEQKVYSSGTVEISCKIYRSDEYKMERLVHDFAVLVFKCCYKFERSSGPLNSNSNATIYIDSDLVQNPKALDDCDWQLLKILHHQVKSFQWEIFKTLKDLVDNVVEEEYTLDQIKQILKDKGE